MKSVSGGQRWNKHAKLRQLVEVVLVALVAGASGVQGLPKVFRNNEICGMYNGHRVYLELGDRGQLQATNVTFSKTNYTIPSICTLELVTCPSCNFKISLSYSNFPTKCPTNHNEVPCRCDYLEFSEPPFDVEQSGRRNCGHDVVYQTQTRSVLIRFLYWGNHSHAFTLEYVAERNRETLQGNPGGVHNLTGAHTRTIMTPYFPSYYPRDFGKEYVLSCNVEACRVNVIFSDFQLAKTSSMEFYDWNGQRLYAISGGSFRPPVVQSSGPSMIIRFYANGGSGLGYRAKVSFLTLESASNPNMLPDSNCGGVVENIGGAITMMNLVPGDNETRIFDCIWLLKPPNTYAHLKTHMSLKIDTFEKMGPNSMLTVVQGTTSDNAILDVVRPNLGGGLFGPHSYVAPLTAGFYVHLRATFRLQSRMALVYTAFSYLDCFMGSEFLCKNRKCIPVQLRCDGFDHCGDGSDEPESCEMQWETDRIDRRWYSHTPNYYFPKMDRYPDLRTATIIFVASSVGLIMLISALIILLYRTGNRARQQRELQSQLQTISELLVNVIQADSNAPRGPEDVDEPPVYEAPPDYDEIIKVGMDEDIQRKRRRHSSSASGRRSRMRRSRRPSNVSESNNPILEVRLPPEFEGDGPSTSGMLQVPGYASHDQDEDNDDLRDTPWMRTEPDFFMSSRIIEAPTSTSTSQSHSIGCQTAASGTGASGGTNSNSSPPPTYDDSQYFSTSALAVPLSTSVSTSASDNISRGFTEEHPNITLSLAETPPQVTITSATTTVRPSHIWSPSSRSQRPWLAFNSNDELHQSASATSSGSIPAVHTFSPNYDRSQIFDSVDLSQIHEIDAYLLAYGSGSELRSPDGAGSGLDLHSTATGLSHLPSMSSLARNSTAGSSMGSNSRSIISTNYDHVVRNCPRCREPLRYNSHCPTCQPGRSNTIPANMCSACGGKISLEENLDRSQPVASGTGSDGQLGATGVKLCNCFPKFPSQTNIVRSGSANVFPPRPFSADRAEARRSVANLTSNFEAFFNSHIGIPNARR